MSIIALPRNVTHKRQLAKTQQCHAYNLRYIAILGEYVSSFFSAVYIVHSKGSSTSLAN